MRLFRNLFQMTIFKKEGVGLIEIRKLLVNHGKKRMFNSKLLGGFL